jgi:hypothetical protein
MADDGNVLQFRPRPPVGQCQGIGTITFDDGPDRMEISCSISNSNIGPGAGQPSVDIEIFPVEELVDKFDPRQFDVETGEIQPESGWSMPPMKARLIAAVLNMAADRAEHLQTNRPPA